MGSKGWGAAALFFDGAEEVAGPASHKAHLPGFRPLPFASVPWRKKKSEKQDMSSDHILKIQQQTISLSQMEGVAGLSRTRSLEKASVFTWRQHECSRVGSPPWYEGETLGGRKLIFQSWGN